MTIDPKNQNKNLDDDVENLKTTKVEEKVTSYSKVPNTVCECQDRKVEGGGVKEGEGQWKEWRVTEPPFVEFHYPKKG